jgi:hypothetical protein
MDNLQKAVNFFDWWKNKIHGGYINNETFDKIMQKFINKTK